VILNVPDPLGEGLVASLAHPDGNVTGLSHAASAEIAGKRLQLLKDAVPTMGRVAVFISPDTARAEAGFLEFAAQSLHIELLSVSVHEAKEIAGAFVPTRHLSRTTGSFTYRKAIAEGASKLLLPAMFAF
jgi:putative ABC transport system substrate-binding protein